VRLDGGGDYNVARDGAAVEHLAQLALTGDVNAESEAQRLIDEGDRLVRFAREEQPKGDRVRIRHGTEVGDVASERRDVEDVERRAVQGESICEGVGICALFDLPRLEPGGQRRDATAPCAQIA